MKISIRNKSYWIAGILVSIMGLILAKLIAPSSAPELKNILTLIGIGSALGGLIIITFGTKKKIT